MSAAYAIVALVAAQRIAELIYAAHNTRALRQRGAVEIGRTHYPLIVLLHLGWLAAIIVALPNPAPIHWLPLAILVILQIMRVWIIVTLGPYWTTRIITLPGAPLIARGPYRFIRHPNYLVVACEILILPLVFGEVVVAVLFTILNAAVLYWRIREEDDALAARRASPVE